MRIAGLTRERSARLLRAKAGELETMVAGAGELDDFAALQADVALIASLLADHLEDESETS